VKLEAYRVEAFLRDPATARCVLLHGDDVGLIRERGERLRRAVTGGLADDPFQVAELDRAGIADLPNELAALPLTGGRRLVHVRDAGDFAAEPVRRALAGTGAGLVILEAPELPPRSKLRSLIEAARDAVAIGCYPESGRALATVISQALAERDVTIDDEALAWLSGQLGADRAVTRREIEKLALFLGDGGRADLASARACVGDTAGLVLEDALFAATVGDVAAADRASRLALAEGAAPVAVVRAALMHVQRLARARFAVDQGRPVAEAVASIRPPLFRRRLAGFEQALRHWSFAALTGAASRLFEIELACKQGFLPADALARSAVVGLARRAGVVRR
jgi:DNA polymerase-3 subunit delta